MPSLQENSNTSYVILSDVVDLGPEQLPNLYV